MKVERHVPGIVLVCTDAGIIQQVARDDLGITDSDTAGQCFVDLFDPASAEKAGGFFSLLARQGAAFDWELNVQVRARVLALRFVGAVANARYVIAGAPSCWDAAVDCATAVGVNDQDAGAIERAVKQVALRGHTVEAEELRDSYDEFSRLNNELVNMQRKLARKNAELARANTEKDHVLGVVAHDLRNPLGVILSYNQLLESELSHLLAIEQREMLAIIQSSLEYMRRLIDELLDFAKFELGALELRRESVDVVALVEHAVACNRALANRKHIQLRCAADLTVSRLMLDRLKMEQVLNNLLSNAIKFSPPATAVEVHVLHGPGAVLISVKDRGPGIPPNELDRLFKPFQKTSVAPSGGESTTGLGLTIVQRIVTGHGGSIRVESEVGKGTLFQVSLPAPGHPAHPE